MLRLGFIFVIFGLLLSINAFAQNPIDECITYLNAGDYQRAIKAGEKAVRLYPQNPYAYLCLGTAYRVTGLLDLALSNFKKAELYAKSQKDLGLIYTFIGQTYNAKGNYDDALYYFNRALNIFINLNERRGIATLYNNIATVYYNQGDVDKALEYYQKSLDLESDEKQKAKTYNNIALIYDSKEDYNKAIEYFKKAIEISEKYGQYHDVAKIMLNLGNTYRKAKDYDKAKYYLEEGLRRIQKAGDKLWEAHAYKFLGWYYKDINNKELAKEYLLKAYNLYKSIGAEVEAIDALASLKKLE